MYKKILFATDNSDHSKKALPHLFNVASNNNSEVVILNSYYIPDSLNKHRENHYISFEKMESNMIDHGEKILEEVKNELSGKNINCKTVLHKGPPGPSIVETAVKEGCELIIIGSRGLGNIENPLISSVSNYVIHNAKCTVLLVQ